MPQLHSPLSKPLIPPLISLFWSNRARWALLVLPRLGQAAADLQEAAAAALCFHLLLLRQDWIQPSRAEGVAPRVFFFFFFLVFCFFW